MFWLHPFRITVKRFPFDLCAHHIASHHETDIASTSHRITLKNIYFNHVDMYALFECALDYALEYISCKMDLQPIFSNLLHPPMVEEVHRKGDDFHKSNICYKIAGNLQNQWKLNYSTTESVLFRTCF